MILTFCIEMFGDVALRKFWKGKVRYSWRSHDAFVGKKRTIKWSSENRGEHLKRSVRQQSSRKTT